MKSAFAVAVVLVAVSPAVAAADPPPQGIVHVRAKPGTPLREWGYQLYAGNCATCHGPSGVGVLPSMPTRGAGDIRGAGPPLAGVGARAPDFYLRTGYMPLAHVPMQPRRSRVLFSDAEIRALIAYVEYAKHPHDVGGWSLGHLGPVPEGLVAWLIAGAALVATCIVIGKRFEA